MEQTMYTVKIGRYPYALVLKPGATRPETYEGYYNTKELHQNMKDNFGPTVLHIKGSDFQAEVERRQVHTPEVIALLAQHGDLLGQDLSHCLVYGSRSRPMDGLWARIKDAVYIPTRGYYEVGYHTYVAVPGPLDDETISRYELEFVSRPAPQEAAS